MLKENITSNCIFYVGNQRLKVEACEIKEIENLANKELPYLSILIPKDHCSYDVETYLKDQDFIQVEIIITEAKSFKTAFWRFCQVEQLFQSQKETLVILSYPFLSKRWIEQFTKTLDRTYEEVTDSFCQKILGSSLQPYQLELMLTQKNIYAEAILDIDAIITLALLRAKVNFQNRVEFKTSQVTTSFGEKPLYIEVNIHIALSKDKSKEIPFFKIIIPLKIAGLGKVYNFPIIYNFITTSFFSMQNCICKDHHKFISFLVAVTSEHQLEKAFYHLSNLSSIN